MAPANSTNADALRGQSAVVTGGSRGIGLAIARELDRRGCRVMIASRSAQHVREAAATLTRGEAFAPCDVSLAADVDALFSAAEAALGTIDIVVASAGIGRSERSARTVADPVAALPEAEWDEVIDTNLRGMFLVARRAAQHMMRQRRGQIVNISSARGARKGQAFGAAYCAAKMAARAMFESLAAEISPLGIRAFSLLPDAVDTGLIAHTRLARRGSMSAAHLAGLLADLLSLPLDVAVDDPLVSPIRAKLGFAFSDGTPKGCTP
jgi:NAD(P)-dependent dehydrogenase (short-subunit alcohol dehydrogenase family)